MFLSVHCPGVLNPLSLLLWCEGRACTLQGSSTLGQWWSPNREGCRVDPLTADRIRQVYPEGVSGSFDDGCSARVKSSDIGWGITFPGIHVTGSRLACFVYLTRIHHPRPLWSPYSSIAAHAIRVDMSGLTTFTPEQIAAAPQLEPSFEMTLRAADISEEVITGFRVHRIKNAAIFASMDTTAEELKDAVREACGVVTAKYGSPHKVEWANIHNAVARAHGQPIQYLTADRASMLVQFKKQYGLNIHDAKLPA